MRHRKSGRRLGRVSSHRKALMRTLATQFFENEKLVTTVPKAKELRPYAEKIISIAKKETLHARRQALAKLRKRSVVEKLFSDLAPRFADRNGGYCRIVRLGLRKGDAAETALIELIGSEYKPETKPTKATRKAKAAAKDAKDKKEAKAEVAEKKAKGKKTEEKPEKAEKTTKTAKTAKAKKKPAAKAASAKKTKETK